MVREVRESVQGFEDHIRNQAVQYGCSCSQQNHMQHGQRVNHRPRQVQRVQGVETTCVTGSFTHRVSDQEGGAAQEIGQEEKEGTRSISLF